MHPYLRSAVIVVLALAGTFAGLHAQDATGDTRTRNWVGVHGGPAASWHSRFDVRLEPTVKGMGYELGVSYEDDLSRDLTIRGSLTYGAWDAAATVDGVGWHGVRRYAGDDPDSLARDAAVRLVPLRRDITISYPVLGMSVMVVVRTFGIGEGSFDFSAGPSCALVLKSNIRDRLELDPSVEGVFVNNHGYPTENNGRILVQYDDGIPKVERMRIGFVGGVGSRHPIGDDLMVTTSILIDLAVSNVQVAGEWRLFVLRGNIGLQWALR